jgi:hypothetical protein
MGSGAAVETGVEVITSPKLGTELVAEGEPDAVVPEPPQAATARPATNTSSADAQNTIARDLRFP